MALEGFKASVMSANIITAIKDILVMGAIANMDYQDEVKGKGDRIKINELGTPDVLDYDPDGDMTYANLSGTQREIIISESKYFGFKLDDSDNVKITPELILEASGESAHKLKVAEEQYFFKMYNQAGTTKSSVAVDSANVTSTISSIKTSLKKANVMDNMFLVVTPEFEEKMTLAKILLDTNNSDTMKNGYKGKYLGIDIYVSNNLYSSGGTDYLIAGWKKKSMGFVSALTKIETLRHSTKMADVIRGLIVFGGKIIRPNTVVCQPVTYAAEDSI